MNIAIKCLVLEELASDIKPLHPIASGRNKISFPEVLWDSAWDSDTRQRPTHGSHCPEGLPGAPTLLDSSPSSYDPATKGLTFSPYFGFFFKEYKTIY